MTDQSIKLVFNTTRRQFAAMSVATAAASGIGSAAAAAPLSVAERTVSGGALFAPVSGEHPGLVMFASLAASPSANAAIAKELAGQGWAVMLVDAPSGDQAQISATAKAHTDALARQTGVATSGAYNLCSFSAAEPALSLATRAQRKNSVCNGVLFALPAAASKDEARRESLNSATRSLYRLAA